MVADTMPTSVRPPACDSDGYSAARTIGVAAVLLSSAVCFRGLLPWYMFLPLWVLQAEAMSRLFDLGIFGRTKPSVESVAASKNGTYTWEEIAARNGSDAGWVAVDGVVYDVTEFIEKHPGGREMISLALGRDATDLFKSYHPFSDRPARILEKMRIGTVSTYEHPVYEKDTGFYKEACEAVAAYFKDTGLNRKDPLNMVLRMAPAYILFGLTYYVSFIVPNIPFAARFACAAIMGFCQGMPLTGWMHDASHASIGPNEKWWWAVGRLSLDYVSGSSMISWRYQHVVGHHVYTNVMGCDPDLPVKIDKDPRRLVKEQKWRSIYKYQHLYLLPLYGILGLKSRMQDFTEVFSRRMNGPIRVNPISTQDYLRMICGKAVWAFYRFVIPLAYMSTRAVSYGEFFALFMVSEWCTGYWLAFNFQVSHISSDAEFFHKDGSGDRLKGEWARKQIETTVDYGHNSWWAAYLSGALNYQTVHHLFPTVSQYHYPEITPIVMKVAQKHGVKFNVKDNFIGALAGHVQHLKDMGEKGMAAELKLE